jgi:hypothetical protein
MHFPGERLVIKMWGTLTEKGIGGLLKPWQMKRTGKARIDLRIHERKMLEQMEVDILDVRAGRKRLEADGSIKSLPAPVDAAEPTLQLEYETTSSIGLASLVAAVHAGRVANACREEINISKAIIHAEDVLANDKQAASEEPIGDDWIFAWRENAGRVSTEQLQQLWGRMLAGEVKTPGSYSMRTLEFVRSVSQQEAEWINKLGTVAISGIIYRKSKELEQFGVTFGMLLELQNWGVLSGVEALGISRSFWSTSADRFIVALPCHSKALVVEHDDPKQELKLQCCILTKLGSELLTLGTFEPNVDYLKLVGSVIAAKGFRVRLADWQQLTPTEGKFTNDVEIKV